jgi:hypothetical protein
VWFSGSIKRRYKLSLLQPELTSFTRASGFNKVVLHMIFDIPENIVDETEITDRRFSSHWGILVPRINVENGIKLGFVLSHAS